MLNKKLSIIVPVYNVEPYLRKCVDSLLVQDIPSSEYEIIFVDDGSTDNSPQICDDYAKRVNSEKGRVTSIKVIHQKNCGLSAARNAGLKVAQGEYVVFVDSDDYWEPNVLGKLMAQIEQEKLDVLRFDYQNVNENDEVFEPNKTQRFIDKGIEVTDGMTYLNTRMGYACYAVMYIIRKSIVPNFAEGIHYEDVEWLPRMMIRAKRVNSATTTVYNYLIRQGSITKAQGDKEKIRRNVEDQMYVLNQYKMYREQYPNCKWLRSMQSSMAVGVLTIVVREFYGERRDYLNRLRELNVFPLAIADQDLTYARRARIINRLGVYVYCMIMRLRS